MIRNICWHERPLELSVLVGRVFTSVQKVKTVEKREYNQLVFENDDECYGLVHLQDCCESVYIEDICGDLNDLVGVPILSADVVTSDEKTPQEAHPPKKDGPYIDTSYTWTFYHLRTIKGYVTIRWYGSSNGYYSESVDLVMQPRVK